MDKKIAFVTGAAGGIGVAICQRLSADGYLVAATDLDPSRLDGLKAQLGDAARTYAADQTDERAMVDLVARVESEIGPIDAFVNVTGWTHSSRFDAEDSAYWSKVVNINYMALLYTAQPVLKAMIARKRGVMVFVASDAGKVGTATEAVYAGAKAAVIAFAKSIARENARHNINVNCVAPGPTETPLYVEEAKQNPDMIARMLKAIPFRRPAKPADQAAAVSFLLSQDATYITGQTLSVSGGLTMV